MNTFNDFWKNIFGTWFGPNGILGVEMFKTYPVKDYKYF